jgi:hypothetical protein
VRLALAVLVNRLPGRLHDGPFAVHEVANGDVGLHPEVHPVEPPLAEAAEVEGGLAEGLGGDGPGVDRGTTRLRGAFNQADGFAEIGGLRGPLLPGRSAPDHAEVESLA